MSHLTGGLSRTYRQLSTVVFPNYVVDTNRWPARLIYVFFPLSVTEQAWIVLRISRLLYRQFLTRSNRLRFLRLAAPALIALLFAALPLRAQVSLTPTYSMAPPAQHSFIIGVGPLVPDSLFRPGLQLYTDQESYIGTSAGAYHKEFDLNQFGEFADVSSSVATSGAYSFFLGGIVPSVLTVRTSPAPAQILASRPLDGFTGYPTGIALRNSTVSTSSAIPAFMSAAAGTSASSSTPSLIYSSDIGPAGSGNISFQIFGNSGPGAVSSSVGALAMGPDGLLNVLDPGRGSILRYDPNTLDFVSSFSLSGTNTDRNDLVITDNGYIFTAFTDSSGGNIYNYATGNFVGTYSAGTLAAGNGQGGKTSLGYDSATGLVIGYFNIDGAEGVAVIDSTQLDALPEPSSGMLISGVGALGLMMRRRPRTPRRFRK